MDPVLSVMIEAARVGGGVALGHFRAGVAATLKADRSPVTVADREAEQAIAGVLGRAFPDVGLLGEELGARGRSEARFIIDPIDGTRNFVRRVPIWATLIALEERGQVTAGVVYQPITGDLHVARRGGGARLNGERLAVSSIGRLAEATLVHASLNVLRPARCWEGFVRLVDATERQRGFGDFLCYTLIAEGKAEIAIGLDAKLWDLAPLALLVEEAGGCLTDLGGARALASGPVLATNGRLHEAALRLLRGP